MAMAVETRLELVGKRFLCVAVGEEARPEHGESGRCWRGWRAGVIRAVSHRDSRNPDLAVRERVPPSLPAHACTTDFGQRHLVGLPLVPGAAQPAGGHAPLWSSRSLCRHPLPGSLLTSGPPVGAVWCPEPEAGAPAHTPAGPSAAAREGGQRPAVTVETLRKGGAVSRCGWGRWGRRTEHKTTDGGRGPSSPQSLSSQKSYWCRG